MAVLPFLWLAAAWGMKNIIQCGEFGHQMKERVIFGQRLAMLILVLNIVMQAFLPYSPLSFRFAWDRLCQSEKIKIGHEMMKKYRSM